MFSKLSSSVRAHAGLSAFVLALFVLVAGTLSGCPARGESGYSQEELRSLRQQNEQMQRELADLKTDRGNGGSSTTDALLIQMLEDMRKGNNGNAATGSDPAIASALESLRTEVRATQADYRALTTKYEALLTEVAERRPVEADLAEAQKENDALRQQLSQLDAERAQLNVLLAQNWTHLLEQLEAQSMSMDAQAMSDELKRAKSELIELRSSYSALQELQATAQTTLTDRDAEIEKLKGENKTLRDQVAALKKEVEDLKLRGGVLPANPEGNPGGNPGDNPTTGVIEGRIGQITVRGDAIVIFPTGVEIRNGMTFNVLNKQGRKIATFKVTSLSTPESITDAQWWGGIVTAIGNETAAKDDRVTTLAGTNG